MAAQLDLIHLRRHALPVYFMTTAAPFSQPFATPFPLTILGAPSRLVATWRLGAGGRPICTWIVDTDDPPLLPA